MEDSAKPTSPKPHNDEQNPHQQKQQSGFWRKLGLGFGLGFQHSPSVDPDPKLNPTSQTSNDRTATEPVASEDTRTLQLISEDIDNQVQKTLLLEERVPVSNECVDKEFDVDHELGTQQTLESKEVEYQKAVEEEIRDLVLEESRNENDDGIGYRNENNFYYNLDMVELEYQQEVEEVIRNLVLEEKRNGFGDEGIGCYSNTSDYNYGGDDDGGDDDDGKSEMEKEDRGNGLVEGETVGPATWRREERYRRSLYPVRPDAEDCSFYVKTGVCKFGPNCKFNHPFRRKNLSAKERVKDREESPERSGQVECKYQLRSGGCKYGKACRYKHSMRKTPAAPVVDFNFLNLPIRPGERECPFYMRNGSCKYGVNCRFNHPDPTAVGGDTLSGPGQGGVLPLHGASQSTMSPWSSPRSLVETSPFLPVTFPPTQGVPSAYPDRNGHQWLGNDHVYPASSEGRLATPPAFSLNAPAEINFYSPLKQPMHIDEFPERPGQPECSYFMKTGNCKYKSGCKFHHPKSRLLQTADPYSPALSDNGLPQRPGQNICSHYNRYGICKFGPACKFDHPVNCHVAAASPAFLAPTMPSAFGNSPTIDDGWD